VSQPLALLIPEAPALSRDFFHWCRFKEPAKSQPPNRPTPVGQALGTKARLRSYFSMSGKVDHYRVRAEECCLKAARAEDNTRRIHWLEAAARWVALGRQEAAMLTTSDSATVANRP
jgi:hypothetical protein